MTAVDDSREPGIAPAVFVHGSTRKGGSPPPAGRSIASAWPTARRCSCTESPCGSRSTTETSAANGTSKAAAARRAASSAGACLGTSEMRSPGSEAGAATFRATTTAAAAQAARIGQRSATTSRAYAAAARLLVVGTPSPLTWESCPGSPVRNRRGDQAPGAGQTAATIRSGQFLGIGRPARVR